MVRGRSRGKWQSPGAGTAREEGCLTSAAGWAGGPGPGLGAGAGHGWNLRGDKPGPREVGSLQTGLGLWQKGIAQPEGTALPSDVRKVGGRRKGAGPSRRQNLMGTQLTAEEVTDPIVPQPITKGRVKTEGQQLNKLHGLLKPVTTKLYTPGRIQSPN